MRGRSLLGGAAALLLAAGCATSPAGGPSQDHPRAPAPSSPTASTTVAARSTGPAPVRATDRSTTRRPPSIPVCTVRTLDVVLAGEEGTAGTIYRGVVFTNTGGQSCTIQGFPGVSFVAGEDGRQVGDAAIRQGEKGPVVTLRPGAAATAPVGFRNIGNFDPAVCQPTQVRGLRVYPPHDRRSEFVPFETTGCAGEVPGGQLVVLTVHAGATLG